MRSQSDPRIPIDILRIVYAAMLEQLPRAAVLDFWLRHAETLGHAPSDPARLLRFLTHEGSRAHRSAVFRVLNDVEPYLIEHDISAEKFVEHAFAHVGGGIMVPAARFVAMALEDFGAFFRRSVDVRRMLLSSIHTFQKRYIPCMIYRVVDVRASKTVTNALMFCSHDTAFDPEVPRIDPDLWCAPFFRNLPVGFDLPKYERVSVVADQRSIAEVVDEGIHVKTRDRSIAEFCASLGWTSGGPVVPDVLVIEALEDVVCPRRKRTVVHKGCVYGAPAYLLRISFTPRMAPARHPLTSVMERSAHRGADPRGSHSDAHTELLTSVSSAARFEFDPVNEVIYLNGSVLLRDTPAKILAVILAEYVDHGRTSFDRKRFICDSTVIATRKNPGFSRRLQIVQAALGAKCPQLRIERVARGKYALRVDCVLVYCRRTR